MPAGTYDVHIGDGTVDIGTGSLPAFAVGSGTSFAVPIGSTPVAQPIGLTVADAPITGSVTGTVSVTITGAGVTIDPTAGSAAVDATFYATVTATNGIISGNCSLGSSGSPISIHLSTANGSNWDPATGAFSMADKTFVMPAPSCSPSLAGTLLAFVLGSTTNPGDNLISLVGTATRRADVTPPPTTPQTGTTGGGTNTTTQTGGNPNETTPLTAPGAAKACVVPKLIGKTLKQAKRAIKEAGCKVGKSKKAYSKKRKKGRIVKQRYKPRTKLPAGTAIPLTVSKGPKKAHDRSTR
jgi:hypothetical protein